MQPENTDRLNHPKMEYYRSIYKNSERWNGMDSLKDKTVIVYCEQGLGDQIQFSRYIPILKKENCNIFLHCNARLHSLFSIFEVNCIDRDEIDIPNHDYHIPSMSLPFHFNNPKINFPYINIEEKNDLGLKGDFFKLGIVWEGNPNHSNNSERSCPLYHFIRIQNKFPKFKIFSLQRQIHDTDLTEGCEKLELYGTKLEDFSDTAKFINSMDVVASIDTSVLHLAGAMNKKTYGLMSYRVDPRWEIPDLNWYPSIKMLRQKHEDDWDSVFDELEIELKNY